MLTIYRRHTKTCPVHKTNLPVRQKRFYVDCECPIWMYGRTGTEIFHRHSTKFTDWSAAEAYRLFSAKKSKAEALRAQQAEEHGPRIDECVARFQTSRQNELCEKTTSQYKILLDRLIAYCEKLGVHHMGGLTVDLLENFKAEGLPTLADTTKGTAVSKLRCFLKEAFRREWITTFLSERVRPHHSIHEEKSPFEDVEIDAILAAPNIRGWAGYATAPETFKLLLEFMLETGLRVSDAVRYDPTACQKGEEVWVYTYFKMKRRKTEKRKAIDAYLSDRLKKAIDNCKWLSVKLPFHFGSDKYSCEQATYMKMQALGKRIGIADCRPHRLRDTFAVRTLLRGVSLDDLSRLLGHASVKVTEGYYAKWVPARGRRLESVMARALTAQSSMNLGCDALGNR